MNLVDSMFQLFGIDPLIQIESFTQMFWIVIRCGVGISAIGLFFNGVFSVGRTVCGMGRIV